MNADVERLSASIRESELIERVRGKGEEAVVLEALKELIHRRRKGRENLFDEIMKDPQHSTAAKRVVAIELGKEQLPENEALLMQQVDTRDEKVLEAVAESLGRIGDQQALNALEKARMPKDDAARRTLNFAQSLLSYRLRLGQHLLPVPGVVEVSEGIPIEVTQPNPEVITRALKTIKTDLPAIELAEETATVLNCQGKELILMFTRGFETTAGLQSLSERNALPLVIIKSAESLEGYMLDTYFFTQPDKEGKSIALLGTRPGGAQTYAGTVELTAQTARFSLRSVETRYAPAVEIEGTYSARSKSFKFDRALTSTRMAARTKTPSPSQAVRAVPTIVRKTGR